MLSNGDWGGRLTNISFAIKGACRCLKIAQVVANEDGGSSRSLAMQQEYWSGKSLTLSEIANSWTPIFFTNSFG